MADHDFLAVFQEEVGELIKATLIIAPHALARATLLEESTDARRQ
jgi:hypothetical protein